MIKPKRTAEEYEQSKLGGGKSGNSNSGGSSGLITPKRTASEFEGYKRGDDAWYSSDEQIRPSMGSGNGSSRLAEAARLKAEGDARKVGRLYSIYSRRLRDASASAQATSARQRYDYYDQLYKDAIADIGNDVTTNRSGKVDANKAAQRDAYKAERDKWAGYVRQIEAGKTLEIESTPYADWMYAINTDQYGKAAAQGQAQLTQEAVDRRGNYTRNQLEAMRDREAAQGNDIMVNAYNAAIDAKKTDATNSIVDSIRRSDAYKNFNVAKAWEGRNWDTEEIDGEIVFADTYMTYDEHKLYSYLLKNGTTNGLSVDAYYAMLRPKIERRKMQLLKDIQAEKVKKGWLSAALANLDRVGYNAVSGAGYLGAAIDAITGGEVTEDRPYFAFGTMADAIGDATREEIVNGLGGGFGADAAAFAYDTGMSIADFVASYYATGGGTLGKIGEAAMLTLMGTKAAESTTRDSLERGATQEQALVNGAAAGIAEVLFEKLSIENFESIKNLLTSSSYIKRVLSQAGVEASEEMCTEIANILTDRAIMGDKSEYETAVKQYREQGMTLAEAEAQANLDMAKRVGLSGLGGFISGGTTGSFAAAMSAGEQSKLGKYVLDNDTALYNTLSYARLRGAEQAGQIATDLADGKITYDEARKAYKGKTRDLGGIFAQMVGEAYETQVARGMTPNAQLGTNPTADDIIAYSNAMFAERANAPIETETETETQSQEQTQPDRLMLAAQQAAQGQTESVPADLESAARQSVERQETQRQERRAAQIRQTQEQREAVREGIRTQLDGAVSPAAADTASAAYDGVSDVGAYIRATYAIDNAARAGQSLDSINSNIAAAIPEQTRTAIYNAAVSAYKAQNSVVDEIPAKAETTAETNAQTATEGKTEAKANTVTETEAQTVAEVQETSYTHDASTRGGLVYAEGVTPKSKAEANAAKALDIALKAVGITVNVKGNNGVDVVLSDGTVKKGAAYGLYNKGNGEISTEGISLVTILHESVHKIGNEVSAEDWTAFKDAVISAARDAGVDVDAQRQSLEDAYSGIEDSAQSIDEEQIAYIVGQLADKPDLAEHFAARFIKDEQTQSLFKRLIDKIKELLGRIRDALTRRKYYKASEAIATDIDALDKVESAYFDALEKLRDGAAAETDATINAEDGVVITEQDGMKVGSLYSVKYLLDDKQRSKAENRIADKLGIDVSEVKSWLDAETSIASLVLNPKYSEFLDYEADPSETAIKKNSDYPQGTVDFSNVCPKRRDLTNVMGIVMRKFPNHIFTSEDVADTINILKDSGLNFPCSACFVEDRRQNDFGIAQNFLDSLEIYRNGGTIRPDGKPFNANQLKALALIKTDTYTPSIYELATLEGRNVLKEKDSAMEAAWKKFNNARGMQSARLLTNEAEYKRQIRRYSKRTVNNKNNRGGLRVYSFSDGEMYHLIDMIQIICDSSEVGLMLQGYSKQNKFVAAIKDTGVRLLRSCIPKGELGYKVIDGRAVLDFDTVEGIDINDEYFFDSSDNPYIGNNVIGVSDVQIRAAMRDDFIDQIIPFHTGQSEEVLKRKGIDGWGNYKDSQTEKDKATGKVSAHQVNFYTEVLEAAEKEGKPIKNKRDFVEKFLSVCKENGLIPRFSQFLNIDQNGEFVYTPGYEKFLVDFKMFAHDAEGTYIPLSGVKPIFDVALITQMLEEYVDERKAKDAEFEAKQPELLKKIEEKVIKRGGNVYELKDPDDAAYRKLERKNTQLEKKVAALKQELKRTNGMVVKDGEAKKLAAKIVNDYSSSYDKQTLEDNLQKTFDFFAAKQEDGKTGLEHFEEAMPQLRAMARDIINRSSEPIAELEEFYKPIRDMLRKTKITPTPEQKAEIADWGKFVRENRGKIAIAKEGGATVLTLYENLVEADPSYFESDIPEEDMLPAIAEYVNNTAAPTYVNPFDEFMDEAVDGLAHEIVGEYLVAPKLKTFADKKFAEKEAALKKQGERLKAQTDKVRDTYKQKLKDQRQTASDKLKEKTGEIRTAYKQKIADQRANAAAAKKALREDLKERQKRKVIKSRITQRLAKLNKWLKSPEKRAYVPQSLIKSATEAAQFVSEKLSRADYYDSRIPVLENKIKNAKSAEQKLKYGEYLAKIRKQGDSARDKLNALINSYDEIITQMKQDEQDTTVKESVVDSIKDAREYLGDTAVNKMSSEQLKALEDVLKLVMSDIDYARKEFSGEKAKEAFDLGKRIADNLSEVQNKGDIAIAAKTLNGDRFLRRLGGYAKDNPFDALADKWTDGTRRKIAAERDLTGLFDDLMNDKAKMKQLKAMRDEKNAVELTVNGEKISLTHAEMINLYGQLNDEDALRHIIYGGETLRRDTKGQKTGRNRRIMPAKIDLGVRTAIEKNSELSGYDKEVLLNELDIEVMAQYEQLKRDIESKMTDYDRAWYKTIRKMFDSVSPALIDEQNLNEFGFRKATQPNYWRIETDKNFVSSEEAWSTLKYDANPANMGFMKKRIRGKKPIVLRDVTEFVDSYIRDTSTYVGMLAPSLYTKRVLSAQDPDRAWSVREALEVYGKTALGTINELMEDNIGLKANAGSMLMNRLRGGLAQSSLMLNPAVSVGQAASFFPAYPYLSAKELAKGLFVKPSSIPEEIMAKYSPYYWTRTKGYSLQQYADVGKDKMSEITQRGKAVLGWITGMDLFTVRRLWMAAEEQVKSDRPDLKIGTKEQIEKGESPFYKEVAKRYEEMLIRTQPVYAAQQRTGLARSKNEILRSFSMFRTVRDQNFGEVYEAIGRLHRYTQDAKTGAHGTTKEDVKAARKHLAKVIIGQLLSALMLVGLKEIAKLLLDHNADDFKDEYGEIDLGAAAGSLGINFLESLASNVLFGSDIYSLVKSMIDGSTYYGIDVNVTGIANDFLNSIRNITQNFNGTTVYNLAVSVSQILGVPLRNTVKMIEGAAESVNDIANGLAGTYASEFDRKNFRMTLDGITPSRLYKAIKDGNSARADKYREVLMGMVNEKGEKKYTTSDIDRAVAKLLAADDDRIKEAYEAKKSKDTETVEKLRGEIVADGFTRDMFNTAIDAYENSLKLEDDEEVAEEDKVLETSSYSTTELCDAILDGDKDAENGMIDVLKKEGKTGEQIKMNVKTDLKDRYQELYRTEGEKAAVELGKQIISKAGERYELSNYTINRWAAVVEACDNEDIAAANRKISLIKDKSELGYLKTTLSGYYKREYEVAINTEDKERQKELEKQMRNINLYDATTGERYFSSEKLSEWRKEFNF